MKRLLLFTTLAVAAWTGTAASASASAFGLFYARDCNSCGAFCVRPYNAFSGVACGVACGTQDCGRGCDPLSWLFGCDGFGPRGDDQSGAFSNCGPRIPFYGVPTKSHGYNPGCNMNWGGGPVHVAGHTPPPGPYVTPPNYACQHYYLPPQPFPGMYGIPQAPAMAGYYAAPYGMPYGMTPAPAQAPAANKNPGNVKPVSYQPAAPTYNPYQQMQGWYPVYYMPQGYYGWYGY